MKHAQRIVHLIPLICLGPCAVAGASDFIVGADTTMIAKSEEAGCVFTVKGEKRDVFPILKEHGFNCIRLRVFHTPDGKGPICCDLKYVAGIARRAKAAGLKLLVDFHYSDTWADPGAQKKPAAWAQLNFDELKRAVHDYTKDSVATLAREGVTPDMIQCGNEVNMGMLWDDGKTTSDAQWGRFAELVKSAVDGARAALKPEDQVRFMHHVADPRHIVWHFDHLTKHGFEPDIIGVSYYPFWHGTLSELTRHLAIVSEKYRKDIVIAETAYAWTNRSFDKHGDIHHGRPAEGMPAYTPEGQAEFYRQLIAILKAVPGQRAIGFFCWEPTWLPNDQFGSPMDNLTLFDEKGEALPALEAIRDGSRKEQP